MIVFRKSIDVFRPMFRNRNASLKSPSVGQRIEDPMQDPVLYGDVASPPVRFVLITASLLQTKLKFQMIDLFRSEHKTESFKQINPHQKVPALVVGNECICDSHAIAIYLCRRTKDQSLYPNDDLMKARVDEMLFFNATTLFPADSAIYSDFFAGKGPVSETQLGNWFTQLDFLEQRLRKFPWLSGDQMTLSDVCCAMTVSSLALLVPVPKKYKNLHNWMQKLELLPSFEINRQGLSRLACFVDSMNSNNVHKK